MRQRLALALALLADPPVLLLDEPTANLDTQARWDYLALLAGLRAEGKTILSASHRLEEVEALADRVLLLQQGNDWVDTCGRVAAAYRARIRGSCRVAKWRGCRVAMVWRNIVYGNPRLWLNH